ERLRADSSCWGDFAVTGQRFSQAGLLLVLAGFQFAWPAEFLTEAQREITFGACFSTDGRQLARSTSLGVAVFDLESGEVTRLGGFGGRVTFSSDNRLLVCGDVAN